MNTANTTHDMQSYSGLPASIITLPYIRSLYIPLHPCLHDIRLYYIISRYIPLSYIRFYTLDWIRSHLHRSSFHDSWHCYVLIKILDLISFNVSNYSYCFVWCPNKRNIKQYIISLYHIVRYYWHHRALHRVNFHCITLHTWDKVQQSRSNKIHIHLIRYPVDSGPCLCLHQPSSAYWSGHADLPQLPQQRSKVLSENRWFQQITFFSFSK